MTIYSQDIEGKEILAQIKCHNSATNVSKMSCDNPNVDLININAYIKFGEILSISSQDIGWNGNFGIN